MNKNDYISAMQHVNMSEEFKAEMLKKLACAPAAPAKKVIRFRRLAPLAACAMILAAAPFALKAYQQFTPGPKAAAQENMAMTAQAPTPAVPPDKKTMLGTTAMGKASDAGGAQNNSPKVPTADTSTATATDGADMSTAAKAEELLLAGKAYKEVQDKAGGYIADGLTIISRELVSDADSNLDNIQSVYKFTVREKDSTENLVLYVAI